MRYVKNVEEYVGIIMKKYEGICVFNQIERESAKEGFGIQKNRREKEDGKRESEKGSWGESWSFNLFLYPRRHPDYIHDFSSS